MKIKANAKFLDNMAFECQVNGHKIIIDADENVGGNDRGPQPKPLMLVALAGCTGMDVISILRKMRVDIDDFDVVVEANTTTEHPKHYDEMKIIYKFWGKDLPLDKIKKAISLSEERYCGVSFTYRQAMKLTSEIVINEKVQ